MATCGASSAQSDTPAPSLVVNLLNANRDVQENSSDDHSPSSGSISPQGEETSSGDEGGWQEAPSSAKKKKRVLNRSGEADGDERRGALGAPLSLALGNPVIPLGLMRIKRVVPPKAHTVIELGSGSKLPKKNSHVGLKSTGSNEEESKSDDGIVEIFMRSDEMSLEQVERCIDKATVIACGGCDQIGRSYRKLKDLPPVFKCESSPCEHYLCAWCGIAGLKAFAGNRDQAVVHEIRCKCWS